MLLDCRHFRLICLIFVTGLLFSSPSLALKKSKASIRKNSKKTFVSSPDPHPQQRKKIDAPLSSFAPYQVRSLLGLSLVRSSGFIIGTQLGFKPKGDIPLYFGPELNFTLFSSGHLFNVMAGGWFEVHIPNSPTFSLQLGALTGIGFAESVPNVSRTHFNLYFDIAMAQDIDDLVTIRGQARPGLVDGKFAFMMNFNVGFRLY